MPTATKLQKYGLAAIGALLLAWGVTNPYFRDGEQLLTARFCLPLAVAISCFLLARATGSQWENGARWLMVLITGQAATQQLVQPTGQVGYQHYLTLTDISTPMEIISLLLIALQTGIVFIALAPAIKPISHWLVKEFRVWQLGIVILLSSIAASAPSLNLFNFGIEFLFAAFIQLLGLLTVIQLVRSLPPTFLEHVTIRLRTLDIIPKPADRPEPGGIDRFAGLAAVWVVLISALLNVFVYEMHPHIADEVVYLLHAGYLSQGLLAMPLPPVPEAFNIDLMIYEPDRWFSAFPPGWPAMLALGSFFDIPWIVNPLLAGICVLLAYLLMRELYSRSTARLIVLLLCLSPWFIFLAMSYMAHIFTLACVLTAALAIARLRRHTRLLPAILAGAMLGITSLIRPLDGLAAAALLGLWSLGIPTWRGKLTVIPLLAITSILVGALVLPYNKLLTGDPATFPVMAYFDKYYGEGVNALGFGPDRGLDWRGLDPFPGHGFADVILNNYLNTFASNVELFGWVTGSLWLVFLVFITGAARRLDFQMLLVVLVVAGLHSLYWFNGGPDYGARYWFLILLPLIILTVHGACLIGERLPSRQHGMTQVITGILALCMASAVTFVPWRAIDKYFHYKNMRPDIRRLARNNDFTNSLVLIKGGRFDDYMSAAVYNAPDIVSGTTIYAWDRDPVIRKRLLNAFGNRRVWLVDGPTVTGAGFRIVAGPLNSGEVTAMETNDSWTK